MNRRTPPTRAQLAASMAAALAADDEASLRAAIGELLLALGWDETARIIDQLRADDPRAKRLGDLQAWVVADSGPRGPAG